MTFRGHRYRGNEGCQGEKSRFVSDSPVLTQAHTPGLVPTRCSFSPVQREGRNKSQEQSYPSGQIRHLKPYHESLASGPHPPQLRSLAVDSAHLHFHFHHWDEYEQRRQRVTSTQFTHEYNQYVQHFEARNQALAPKKDSSELLGEKDELKALQVAKQREELMRQREVLEGIRKQRGVQEIRKALSLQIAEKQQIAQYEKDLDSAYAQQIDYRVARTREIELNRYQKEIDLKKAHQSALLEQISHRSESKSELKRVKDEENTVVKGTLPRFRQATYRQGSIFSQNAAKVISS